MKFEYIVVYENISDKFDNGHCRIKVKVTVGLFSPFTTIQTIRSYNSTLIEARKLISSMYVQSTMNTALFVNATIGFSEHLFLSK